MQQDTGKIRYIAYVGDLEYLEDTFGQSYTLHMKGVGGGKGILTIETAFPEGVRKFVDTHFLLTEIPNGCTPI